MAAELSHRLGRISAEEVSRACGLIERAGLPILPPEEMSPKHFIELMSVDKKVLEGRLRLVLLNAIGSAFVTDEFDLSKLHETLERYYP
jgi:3-dehydroquinate synthase